MKFYLDKGGQVLLPATEGAECLQRLIPDSTDAAQEKHVPQVSRQGERVEVRVGENAHPMTEAHLIDWVLLETDRGHHLRRLTPSDPPQAEFTLAQGEEPVAAYGYCNLHGLWKKEL